MGRRDVLHVMERLREHTNIFYSTHILDDVQRVSDSVAILNRGTFGTFGAKRALAASRLGPFSASRAHGNPTRSCTAPRLSC